MRLDSVAIASLLLFLDDTPLLLCRAFVSRVLLKQWTRCRGSLGRLHCTPYISLIYSLRWKSSQKLSSLPITYTLLQHAHYMHKYERRQEFHS